MNETLYKVVGKDSKTGVERNNEPYIIENLSIDFNGKNARVRAPRDIEVNIGDMVRLGIGTRRSWGTAEVCVVITDVFEGNQK